MIRGLALVTSRLARLEARHEAPGVRYSVEVIPWDDLGAWERRAERGAGDGPVRWLALPEKAPDAAAWCALAHQRWPLAQGRQP